MEIDYPSEEINPAKLVSFMDFIANSSWMLTADEDVIDLVFNQAVIIQEDISQGVIEIHQDLIDKYSGMDFKNLLNTVMENLIRNPNLNEHLTLYAIKKYLLHYPTNDFCKILENILTEIKVKENLMLLFEKLSGVQVVDVDWHKINFLLDELNTSTNELCDFKILSSLKTQTSILLNALEHGSLMNESTLIQKIIDCLEAQNDLKLWFTLLKGDHLKLVMSLCAKHKNFLNAVFKFFDRFADEIETNYDEDLNLKYSHLNLDFDEFLGLFKLFLQEKSIGEVVEEYIENKIALEDKNFLFWVDIKACI